MNAESFLPEDPNLGDKLQRDLPLSPQLQAREALVNLLLGFAAEKGRYAQTPEIQAQYLRTAGMFLTDLPNAHRRVLDTAQTLPPTDQQSLFSGYAEQTARDTILAGKAKPTEATQPQITAFTQRTMMFLQDSLAARTLPAATPVSAPSV